MAARIPDSLERLTPAELFGVVRELIGEVGRLRAENEKLSGALAKLKGEHQAVKDELARLKKLPPRPPQKPSGMDNATDQGGSGGGTKSLGGSGLQHPGPNPPQDMLAALPLQHNAVDAVSIKNMGQKQSSRPAADDCHLGSHPRFHHLSQTACGDTQGPIAKNGKRISLRQRPIKQMHRLSHISSGSVASLPDMAAVETRIAPRPRLDCCVAQSASEMGQNEPSRPRRGAAGPPSIADATRDAQVASHVDLLGDCKGVLRANGLITVQLGPDQIVAMLSLEFTDTMLAPDIEEVVISLERSLREANPEIVALFVKPQTAKTYQEQRDRALSP